MSQRSGKRFLTVDVMRGLAMFFIVGTEGGNSALSYAFGKISSSGLFGFLAYQFKHRPWEGLVFYDLIYPAFVFVMGMSIHFSLQKYTSKRDLSPAYRRIFKRLILLFAMGFIFDLGMQEIHKEDVLCGVLQRLAIVGFFTSMICLHLTPRGSIGMFWVIIGGYWAVLSFVPIPGATDVSFARHQNWTDYIAETYMPYHYSDPDSWFGNLPAICTCLLGVFAARWIQRSDLKDRKKVSGLLVAGAATLLGGYLLSLQFPIIKRIWSPSFMFVTGGYAILTLGVLYHIIEVAKFKKWVTPFVWLGANAITVYMAMSIIDFYDLSKRFVGGPVAGWVGNYDLLLQSVTSVILALLFVRFLYRQKLFLRV